MSMISSLVGSKIAAGVLVAGVVVGGAGVAAYANVLPAPLQQSAHDLIGAPDASTADIETEAVEAVSVETDTNIPSTLAVADEPSAAATPVGPDVTGPAAYGLCNAYTHGGLAVSSTPYASWVIAAEGDANIATYCATVLQPGNSATHRSVSPDTADAETESSAPEAARTEKKNVRELPTQADVGTSHKPASNGRP